MFCELNQRIRSAILAGVSRERVALSCSVGTFIAFSPFIGAHWFMAGAAVWCFRLNLPLVLLIAYGVNNPWTFAPICLASYAVGRAMMRMIPILCTLSESFVGFDAVCHCLRERVGLDASALWAFLIGGTMLSVCAAALTYIAVRCWWKNHENTCTEQKSPSRLPNS